MDCLLFHPLEWQNDHAQDMAQQDLHDMLERDDFRNFSFYRRKYCKHGEHVSIYRREFSPHSRRGGNNHKKRSYTRGQKCHREHKSDKFLVNNEYIFFTYFSI